MARKRTKVTFIGLGTMGAPMAENLLKADYPLTVWNRTAEKAGPLVAAGARKAGTPAEAAKGADFVLLMLADDSAVDSVIFGEDGLARALKRRSMVINCSTNSPAMSYRAAVALRNLQVRYLEAPVMWSRQAAREGKLQVLVGGSRDDFARAKGLLDALAKDVHYIGDVGKGMTMKLACNLMVAAMMQVFAEYFTMGRKAGIPFETMMEVLHAGPLEAPLYRMAEQSIVNPGGRVNFLLRHMLKDTNMAGDIARSMDVPIPLTAEVRQLLAAMKNMGRGDDDFSAMIEVMAGWAGVNIRG